MTRVNICHVNKARGCFSPLRNRICNDMAPLMFLSQYNMYLNEDESRPVRARPRKGVEGTQRVGTVMSLEEAEQGGKWAGL